MAKEIVALIIFVNEEDKEQQISNIKKHIKNAVQMELVGLIKLPHTFLPQDMENALKAIVNVGIHTIMIDASLIADKLVEELHSYVSHQQLELLEINKKLMRFKRFLMILPDEKDNERLQLQNAIIKYSKLESIKEVMDIIAIATEFSVIEIIVLSDQDTKWTQNTCLYKLQSIAEVLNINVRFTTTLKDVHNE